VKILERKNLKVVLSKKYNYIFSKSSGFFARWGKTKEDDPVMSPVGPEIADIEISTICHGIGKTKRHCHPCSFCYKSNTRRGKNMSFETFKEIFHKLPKNLTQIAFGIGDIDGNPDLFRIMDYCRDNPANRIVPNVTVNGMGVDKMVSERLANVCGAVAVSRYSLPDVCYNAVYNLSNAGLKQVNIHQLLSKETYTRCLRLIDDAKTDKRLEGLNAIVFLLLKPKGRRNRMHSIDNVEMFKKLYVKAKEKGVQIGMDSCSAPMMLKTAAELGEESVIPSVEPCESTLFSIYINVNGEVFPCSFTEDTNGWRTGIDMLEVNDFMKDVWFSERLSNWRSELLDSTKNCNGCSVKKHCRACPAYDITPCRK
jgi:radical SAM protein with 4Fe4S-binding SPASM domain